MKHIILTFLIITSSCKENNLVNNQKLVDNKVPFYDMILDELENLDMSEFYISYEIKKDFNITSDIYEAIRNMNLLNTKENLNGTSFFESFDSELSNKKKEIINSSEKNKLNKIELNYQFSYPYLINENKVLIINSVKYRNPITKDVKGGSERVIILSKINGNWKILKKVNLIEI